MKKSDGGKIALFDRSMIGILLLVPIFLVAYIVRGMFELLACVTGRPLEEPVSDPLGHD